jgi:2,4-dienoyl-CoA reductase-like NADH-dependent reductase (Old Yellow Enzyme family)
VYIRNEFVSAAELYKQAGCDGIELHGAHGFFLNMVASPLSNKRGDQYGGDINGRLLLVKKIVKEIKAFANEGRTCQWSINGEKCLLIKRENYPLR